MSKFIVSVHVYKKSPKGACLTPSIIAHYPVDAAAPSEAAYSVEDRIQRQLIALHEHTELRFGVDVLSCLPFEVSWGESAILFGIPPAPVAENTTHYFVDIMMDVKDDQGCSLGGFPLSRVFVKSSDREQAMIDALMWHGDGIQPNDIVENEVIINGVTLKAAFVYPMDHTKTLQFFSKIGLNTDVIERDVQF